MFDIIRAPAVTSVAIALLLAPVSANAESLLFSFHKGGGGHTPLSRLTLDRSTGILYGTTEKGGKYNFGTVFQLAFVNGAWRETVLYSFQGRFQGAYPKSGVFRDNAGALYGTTEQGGSNNNGVIYEVYESGGFWTEKVLHSFSGGGGDGSRPYTNMIQDPATSIFYGTTYYGGPQNCGVVYQLSVSGNVWTEKVIANLGGSMGCNPQAALRLDSLGNLYGSTVADGQYGYGIVYQLTQNNGTWQMSVLHNFAGGSDGAYGGELSISATGTLYGLTFQGGSHNLGTVFQLAQNGGSWTETVLHSFAGGSGDGSDPFGLHGDNRTGALYGVTETGGSNNLGTIFTMSQSGGTWHESLFHSFTGAPFDGAYPEAGPDLDPSTNTLYGTTVQGGASNLGSVYNQTF